MNNKKIIFGILLFCAISFLAYTFANPLEKEDDEGKLVPGSNQVQGSNNDNDNNNDNDVIDDSLSDDDLTNDEEIPNEPIDSNPTDTTQTATRPTNPSRPSGGNNTGNNGGSNTPKPTPIVEVTDVTINIPDNTKLIIGKTINLGVNVSPSNATNKNVTYSSDQNVVKIDSNGNATAVGPGTTTIKVTASNGVSKTITVVVLGNSVSKITAVSTKNNTIITSAAQGNTSLALKGSVTKGTDHAIDVRIYVPKEYTTDLLQNLKYNIMTNEYGIGVRDHTYTGIGRINGDVASGDAYVVFPLEFDDDVVIGRDGNLKISVDWLGTGSPIIYSLDFSGVEIK